MNIELSPSQERRLHLILDKGLVALHDRGNTENELNKLPADLDLTFSSQVSNLSHTSIESRGSRGSQGSQGSQGSHLSNVSKTSLAGNRPQAPSELCELQFLRAKLAELESKVQKKPAKVLFKKISPAHTHESKVKSANSGRTSDRPSSASSASKDRVKSIDKIKDAEKAIGRLERSITASPSRKMNTGGRANVEVLIEQERKSGERLRKENEMLRKELAKKEELMALVAKLQDEYAELAASFEKSEQIRKKQKVLIEQLKLEIKTMNVENGGLAKKKKPRKACKN